MGQKDRGEGLDTPASSLDWFAVQVRSRREHCVAKALESKGYECLLPVYERRRRWTDRVATIKEPLFRGYVFCRLNGLMGSKIVTTPGVIRLVGFGGKPVPIDQSEIQAVRRIVDSGLAAAPHCYLKAGQTVRIVRGPLSGVEGVLIRMKANHNLVVSVNLLRRSVSVEIEDNWLSPQSVPHAEPRSQAGERELDWKGCLSSA